MTALPDRIEPMLATLGPAFDSDEHLFEIKWDGFRTLVFVDPGDFRLQSRRGLDMAPRFPELHFLAELEPGLVLDGEMVILRDGRPDFHALLSRERSRRVTPGKLPKGVLPATYVAFDVLYRGHTSQMQRPLIERRQILQEVLAKFDDPRLVLSDGITGSGIAFFEQACARDLEGVVAKRLDSRYLPGKRTEAWTKFKKRASIPCLILGFDAAGADDLRSLILAAELDGVLRFVGKVGTGFDEAERRRVAGLLHGRLAERPVVECPIAGTWVEPGFFCEVSYVELTPDGNLRAPVYVRMIEA